MKKWFSNPNYLFVIVFSIAFGVYALQWSTLYPPLSNSLLIFFAAVFAFCLVLGIITQKVAPLEYNSISISNYNLIIVILIYFFYGIEVLYSRQLPFIQMMQGTFDYGEYLFGIPVLHTLVVSFNIFYCVYLFHQYLSTKKKILLLYYIVLLVAFILLAARSYIILIFGSSVFIYFLSRKNISKATILKITCAILIVLWAFGYFGNLRSSASDSLSLPEGTEATDKFIESSIPKEYYWTYLYAASPMANLQNNINHVKYSEASWSKLFRLECLPESLTKFFPTWANTVTRSDDVPFYQINDFLNVGTVFVYSFSYKRWAGMIFMALYFILYLNIIYFLFRKSQRFAVTGIALICNALILSIFHNPISFSPTSMQLIFPLLFSILRGQGIKV